MRFEFATAQNILFGEGVRRELGTWARSLGQRALVVTGRHPERHGDLLALLGLPYASFTIMGEPTVDGIREGRDRAMRAGADLVIAIGGGSVLDGGKAIAALAVNPGDPLKYLEVVGQGVSLERQPLPMIAVPTTAGTGSEATRNAVLAAPDHGIKVSLRHAGMLPRVAMVDPELTYELPQQLTASTGMDALTQLIEPFVSVRSNPLTDALCREGLRRASRALPRVWEDGSDREARRDMALASLFGGMALANAGLGAVHGLAAPLGGLKPIPHGIACAVLLPHVMDANLRGLPPGHPVQERFRELAGILTGTPRAKSGDGVRWVTALVERLNIPGLGSFGLGPQELSGVAERALAASSMKANPVALDADTLVGILARSI